MAALVLLLSAAVAALILSIKTAIPADPTSKTNWPLLYLIISLVAAVVGALGFGAANPTLFVGDPLFSNAPVAGELVAAFIAVLPGGVGTSVLTLLYLRAAPGSPSAQAALPKLRGIVLWM